MNINKVSLYFLIFVNCIVLLSSATQLAAQSSCAPVPVGLVSIYSGDGNALDARSRSNGTIQNNVTYATGKVGQAFNLGGNGDLNGNGDRVLVGNPAGLQLQDFTIETWIKRSSATVVTNSPNAGSPSGIFFAYGNQGYAFLIDQTTGKLGLSNVNVSQVLSSALTVTDTNWHHVAVTKSGNQIIFFVDGAADAPATYNTTFSFTTNAAIGTRGDAQTDNAFFGLIDELSIYNRALTTAEIAAIYNAGTAGKCKPIATTAPGNQVLWLTGDGDAQDSSGNGNNGTNGNIFDGVGFVVGKVGQAFRFDGVNSINVADSPSLRPMTAVTMEAWVNSDPSTNAAFFLFKGNVGSSGGQPYSMFVQPIANDNPAIGARIGNDSTYDTLFSNSKISFNTYNHVAVTYNGTTIKMYLNGVLDASKTTNIGTLAQTNTDPLLVGNGAINRFLGSVDEVSIYNRALTADEIASTYNAGLAGKYKAAATNAGTNSQTKVGDVTVTFANATSAGTTQQMPLDRSKLPALPSTPTRYYGTSLNYDIATTAAFTGSVNECFNLPSFTVQSDFNNLRVLHLENGGWVDRTLSNDFATKTLCARTASLSPFAVVGLNQPTAADVTISGRVLNAKGRALIRARVALTDASGNLQAALTDKFGRYRFENVPAAALYTLKARAVGHSFEQNNKTLFVNGDTTDVDFVAAQ